MNNGHLSTETRLLTTMIGASKTDNCDDNVTLKINLRMVGRTIYRRLETKEQIL
jgi:hypothetical protein